MSSLHDHHSDCPHGPNWSRINQWLLWFGLAAAVGWPFFRHNEHLLQLLPFLILLACPLMHLLGHGERGGHGGPREDWDTAPGVPSRDPGHVHRALTKNSLNNSRKKT
jgi:hypothetical protein